MKKLITILAAILVAVFALFSILGAGGEYAAEKIFYRTMKLADKITMNPDVAPPAQLAQIENGMKLLIKKYPETKIAMLGNVSLLEYYISNKKYSEALDQAAAIEKKYKDNTDILSTAQFLKGITYEKQDKWDKAVEAFDILNEKYPTTKLGMEIPIYIGKYYASKGMEKESGSAYRRASVFYTKMEKNYSGKVLGYTSSILLIQTYINLKDFESAGNALEKTIRNYASPLSYSQLLPAVERIYVSELKNPAKALEIYKFALGQTKDPRIKKYLDQRIKKLSENK